MSIQQQQINYPTTSTFISEPPPPYNSTFNNNIQNNNKLITTNIPYNQQISEEHLIYSSQQQTTQFTSNNPLPPPPPFHLLPPGVPQQTNFIPNNNIINSHIPNINQLNNGQQQQQRIQQQQQLKVIYAIPLGPHEANLECLNCKQPIRTKVFYRPGLLSWLICGALALFGCWPCCVLPFCMQTCQDTEHWCPNCNSFIGKYSRI